MFNRVLGAAVAVLLSVSAANAVTYKITEAINSSADGFRSTLFHKTTGCSAMCGAITDKATGGITGKWNPHTGSIAFQMDLVGGGNVHATGWLDFDNPMGGLVGKIKMTLSGSSTGYNGAYDFAFRDWNYVPAAGVNAFANDIIGLWGAAGGTQNSHNGGFSHAKLGTDLRLQVAAVPLPAPILLLGAAFGALGFGARKRRAATA